MPGKAIGKLSLRVLPDATKFRFDLKRIVDRAERQFEVHLGVFADTKTAEAQLKQLHKKYDGLDINMQARAATKAANTQLKQLHERWNDRTVNFKVTTDRRAITRLFSGLLSPKPIDIDARVRGGRDVSALKASMEGILALSGGRLVRSVFTDITNALKELDLSVPKISRMAVGIGAASASLLSFAAGLVTVSGDILKIANVGLLLPAVLTGVAVGVTALVFAFQDAGAQLAEFGPRFSAIKAIVSENFWAVAKGPISDFLNNVLPSVTAGMGRVGSALGRQMAELARSLDDALGGGVLDRMFDTLVKTMDIATTAVRPLVQAFVTLGDVGSSYLPQLATYISGVATQFNDWMQVVASNGSLRGFIDDGIAGIRDLALSVGGLVGIFRGIDEAATRAGSQGLAGMAAALQGAADVVQSPEFQKALTTLIAGAERGMDGIGRAATAVGGVLQALAPQIAFVMTSAGSTIGTLVEAVASAMEQPAFKNGLVDLFYGIQVGVEALAPAIPGIVAAIGQLGSVVGLAAQYFLPLVVILKDVLAPVFDGIIQVVSRLIPVLAGGLTSAIVFLTPVFQALGSWISQNADGLAQIAGVILVAVAAFRAISIAVGIVNTVLAVAKGIQAGYAAATYGSVAASYVASTAARIGAVAYGIQNLAIAAVNGTLLASVGAWIRSTAAIVANGVVLAAQKVAMVASAVAMTAYNVATKVAAAGQWLLNAAMSANPIALIVIAIAALVAGLIWFFTQTELGRTIWEGFMGFLSDAWANIQMVFQVTIAAIVAAWNMFWTGLSETAANIWNAITGFIQAGISLGQSIIVGVLTAVIGFWQATWNAVGSVVSTVWNAIVGFVTNYINTMRAIILAIMVAVAATWTNTWNNIRNIVSSVVAGVAAFVAGMVSTVQGKIQEAARIVTGIKDTVVSFFSGAGQWLVDSGRKIIDGLASGIRNAVGAVTDAIGGVMGAINDFIPNSPAKKGPMSGKGWSGVRGKSIPNDLASAMTSRLDRVRAAASAMTSAAQLGDVSFTASRVTQGVTTAADGVAASRALARSAGGDIIVNGNMGADPKELFKEADMNKRMAEMAFPLDLALAP